MELELLPFSHSQILPAWSLPEDCAPLEDGLDLNLDDIFCADDLLPRWIGTENKAETLLSENLQDFWGDALCSKQNDALSNSFEDNLSSTFLLPAPPPPSTILSASLDCNIPNVLLTGGFEDLWDTPLLAEDISDIANSSLDESFSSSLASSSPPPLISFPLLPSPLILQEHDYSLSPSLLPTTDENKPKVSGGKSILKRVTRNIHITDIIQGHKKVLRSRPLNRSKKQVRKKDGQKEHNERERCRRGHLKLQLERLRDFLPSLEKSKRPAKKEILDSATIYCHTLATRLEALKKVINQEKLRQENLRIKIARASETVTRKPSKHLSKYHRTRMN